MLEAEAIARQEEQELEERREGDILDVEDTDSGRRESGEDREYSRDSERSFATETFDAWFGGADVHAVHLAGHLGPSQMEGFDFDFELYVSGQPLSASLDAIGLAYYREVFLPELLATKQASWIGTVEHGLVQDGSVTELHGMEATVMHASRALERSEWDDDESLALPPLETEPAENASEEAPPQAEEALIDLNLDQFAAQTTEPAQHDTRFSEFRTVTDTFTLVPEVADTGEVAHTVEESADHVTSVAEVPEVAVVPQERAVAHEEKAPAEPLAPVEQIAAPRREWSGHAESPTAHTEESPEVRAPSVLRTEAESGLDLHDSSKERAPVPKQALTREPIPDHVTDSSQESPTVLSDDARVLEPHAQRLFESQEDLGILEEAESFPTTELRIDQLSVPATEIIRDAETIAELSPPEPAADAFEETGQEFSQETAQSAVHAPSVEQPARNDRVPSAAETKQPAESISTSTGVETADIALPGSPAESVRPSRFQARSEVPTNLPAEAETVEVPAQRSTAGNGATPERGVRRQEELEATRRAAPAPAPLFSPAVVRAAPVEPPKLTTVNR